MLIDAEHAVRSWVGLRPPVVLGRGLHRLAAGDGRIADIVAAIYQGLDPRLRGAAALSVFAHLEDLVGRGLASCDGAPRLDGTYAPA